jgi:peptidoglycan biosynthesis protein MviN/MurJ (putative lipid II flippase)
VSRAILAAMVLERAFRITGKLGQWILAFGLVLAALGMIAWVLAISHLPTQFLFNLGILALPVIFIGFVLVLVAAILQRLLLRRRSSPPPVN